ncbi:MAG: hypothetical protein KF699_08620 [Phycisphaeraceae bacterium]|nr:hypothetical protein [Phycisphaeraceae bacterium]MBX3406133.1 hypothetical protein [Phycisphaeraceae bacterium]
MSWVERLIYAAIIDDRGMRQRVRTSEQSPIGDADIRREFHRSLLGSHRRTLLTWTGLLCVIVAFMFWRGPVMEDVVGYLAAVVMIFAALPLCWWWFDGVRKTSLRRSRFGRGLCAACGYGIRSIPARADGLTICSECGAAWRIDDAHSIAPHHRRGHG